MMKNIFLRVLFMTIGAILLSHHIFGQEYKCIDYKISDEAQGVIDQTKRQTKKTLKSSNTLLTTVLDIYVVRNSNGEMPDGNFTDEDISSEIIELNNNFEEANMNFVSCTTRFINEDELYDGVEANPAGAETYEQSIIRCNMKRSNVINVVFVPKFTPVDGSGNAPRGFNLITISTELKDEITLTHEMGHSLSLYHTFKHENEFNHNGIPGDCNNCLEAGDKLCDTYTDLRFFEDFLCGTMFSFDCPDGTEVSFIPPYTNYMSYHSCREEFSMGQITNMRTNRENAKGNFLSACSGDESSTMNVYPCHCHNLNIDFDEGEVNPDCGGPCKECDDIWYEFDCQSGCNNNLALNCQALTASAGDNTITISNLQIENDGNSNVSNVDIEYSLGSNLIGSYTVNGPLTPGNNTIDGHLVWFNDVPSGSYNLQAKLIYGSGENNSCISEDQIPIGIDPNGSVDYSFTSCGNASATESGFSIQYYLTNYNTGTAPATRIDLYLSEDNLLDDNDDLLTNTNVQTLNGYEAISASINFSIDNSIMPTGDVFIILVVDPQDIVSEAIEDNNTCTYQLNKCDNYSANISGGWNSDIEVTSHIVAPKLPYGNTVNINTGVDVDFKAGDRIDFLPGFTAHYNSTFTAYIEGCDIPTVND